MARPEEVADLPLYLREGHCLVRLEAGYLAEFPDLAALFFAAIHTATADERLEWSDGTLRTILSDDELNAALVRQQNAWDEEHARYTHAHANPDLAMQSLNEHQRNAVDRFAKSNNLPVVVWETPPF